MQKNRFRGPLLTLVAVALLGGGIWWANVSQQQDPQAPSAATQSSVAPAADTTASPAPAPPAAFPARADYVAAVPTANGTITLDVTIDGTEAIAYACDGVDVEVWLRGGATAGELDLASKDGSSTLDGRLDGAALVGTLAIGDRSWPYRAERVAAPGGTRDVR